MSVAIRLSRGGQKKKPFYRIIAVDSRKKRDSAFLDKIGYYDPCKEPAVVEIDKEKLEKWLGNGAQLSDTVKSLIRKVK